MRVLADDGTKEETCTPNLGDSTPGAKSKELN